MKFDKKTKLLLTFLMVLFFQYPLIGVLLFLNLELWLAIVCSVAAIGLMFGLHVLYEHAFRNRYSTGPRNEKGS